MNKYFSKEAIQMTSKYMKICSASLFIRHMQIKTKYLTTPHPFWWLFWKMENSKCWWGCGILIHGWWECKMIQSLWKIVWQFLEKWFIELLLLFSRSVVSLCDPWTAACQTSLSLTISQNLPKFMSTELVMLSNYLILSVIWPSNSTPRYITNINQMKPPTQIPVHECS